MSTINVPFKVRRGGNIKVKESRETVLRRIRDAKRAGTLVTLTEAIDGAIIDIKPGLINSVEA